MRIEQLTVGMMQVCCYIRLLRRNQEAAIIDPGGEEDRILACAASSTLTVQYIIATHGHPDHVCGNRTAPGGNRGQDRHAQG